MSPIHPRASSPKKFGPCCMARFFPQLSRGSGVPIASVLHVSEICIEVRRRNRPLEKHVPRKKITIVYSGTTGVMLRDIMESSHSCNFSGNPFQGNFLPEAKKIRTSGKRKESLTWKSKLSLLLFSLIFTLSFFLLPGFLPQSPPNFQLSPDTLRAKSTPPHRLPFPPYGPAVGHKN